MNQDLINGTRSLDKGSIRHVHAEKGDMECKYWLLIEEVEIREALSFNLTPSAKKEIKKINLLKEHYKNLFT